MAKKRVTEMKPHQMYSKFYKSGLKFGKRRVSAFYRGGGVGLACCMLAKGLVRLLERSEKPPSVEITIAFGPVGVLPGALILDSSRAMRCAA